MGYTHYWTFGAFIEEKAYKTALTECRKIIKASPVPLGNAFGEGKPKLNNGVWFNGVAEGAHETFALDREPIRESGSENTGFNFCKTARKPYDVVVTACLCVLQEHLGKHVNVSSDGEPGEWEQGRALATKVLGRDFAIPPVIMRLESFVEGYREKYFEDHPEYGPYVRLEG